MSEQAETSKTNEPGKSAVSSSSKKRKKDWRVGKKGKSQGRGDRGKQKHYRRSPDNDQDTMVISAGSYASPSMQELFGIKINKPQLTLTKSQKEDLQKTNGDESKEAANNTEGDSDVSFRFPKRKVAMLLAFVGEQYSGFQMNVGQKTIQAELEMALYRAGLLSDANFGYPKKYGWSSSARTDKGVHACAQVCSVKVAVPPSFTMDDVRTAINDQLPPDVRVLDVVRTTRSFCAHTQRDHVRYQYMIPSFMLYDRDALRKLFESHNCHGNDRHPSDPLTQEQVDAIQHELVSFRAPRNKLDRLREALSMYVGTHSFHNFTSKKSSDDASSTRYITAFEMQDPIVLEDGSEWITTQVTGQSFLLHQIRKMISLAIDVARGTAETRTMTQAMSKCKMQVNVAPAQGLFLDMSFFYHYNRKQKDNDDLDWDRSTSTPAMDRWREYKETVVMKHIVKEEARDGNFIKYLFVQEYIFEFHNHYRLQEEQKDD